MIKERILLIFISLYTGTAILSIINLFLPTLSGLIILVPFFGSYILSILIVYFVYKTFR